jgi:hypothetical protein
MGSPSVVLDRRRARPGTIARRRPAVGEATDPKKNRKTNGWL